MHLYTYMYIQPNGVLLERQSCYTMCCGNPCGFHMPQENDMVSRAMAFEYFRWKGVLDVTNTLYVFFSLSVVSLHTGSLHPKNKINNLCVKKHCLSDMAQIFTLYQEYQCSCATCTSIYLYHNSKEHLINLSLSCYEITLSCKYHHFIIHFVFNMFLLI